MSRKWEWRSFGSNWWWASRLTGPLHAPVTVRVFGPGVVQRNGKYHATCLVHEGEVLLLEEVMARTFNEARQEAIDLCARRFRGGDDLLVPDGWGVVPAPDEHERAQIEMAFQVGYPHAAPPLKMFEQHFDATTQMQACFAPPVYAPDKQGRLPCRPSRRTSEKAWGTS